MQETWVRSLGRKDPLEKEMAPHSSTLAWKIPWMEDPGSLQSMGSQRVRHDWATSLSSFLSFKIDWFDLLAIQGTLKSLLQHHSSKASILQHSAFFMVHLSHLYLTTDFARLAGKVMSLLFNMLSRFVIAFLPRSKHLLIYGSCHCLQWFRAQEKNLPLFPLFPLLFAMK